MPTPSRRNSPVSALDAALLRVGDRWSLLLVEALLPGPQRFNELLEGLDGLAPNILSARLKALEAEGILASRPYSQRPYRVAYVLTARGAELASALRLLAHWGGATLIVPGSIGNGAPPRSVWHGRGDPVVVPNLRSGGGRPRGARPRLRVRRLRHLRRG